MTTRTEISADLIRSLSDMRAALRTCVLYSGKQLKEIGYELEISPDHLSKMLNPSDDPRHFPPNKIGQLMTACGNELPLLWLLLSRGYDLPRQVGHLQDENARLKAEVKRLEGERHHVLNIFKTLEVK